MLLVVEALYQTIKPSEKPHSFVLPAELARPMVVARVEKTL